MRRLAACVDLDQTLAPRLGCLWRGLEQVQECTPTFGLIRDIQLNRHSSGYGLILSICALLLSKILEPGDSAGEFRFSDPRRDDAHMARVFQEFLTAWWDRHRDPAEFRYAGATVLRWPAQGSASDLSHLPEMMTDITLTGPQRTVIIEAKYLPRGLGRPSRRRNKKSHQRTSLSVARLSFRVAP